ncbi:O-antigen ligase family protein [Candidatus Poriferisodalis sp.]|uniref:O-antigen ligase family protein n=1 Tax=Candidatus Poriferisodalis sp. TaxID=3101277 RepID=UPI003AF760D9
MRERTRRRRNPESLSLTQTPDSAADGHGSQRAERLPASLVAGLALVVVGSGVAFDPWGWSGYLSPKVLIAAGGTLLLVVQLGRGGMLVVPRGCLLWGGVALGGFVVAASIASDSVLRSMLGAPLRQEGLLAWLGFAVAFVVGLSLRRSFGDAADGSVVQVAVVAVLAVGTLGAFEFAGLEIDSDLIEFRGRVRSTLGNPAVLGGFVVLLGPVAAVAMTRVGRWRIAGAAAAGLAVLSAWTSQTRGVWVSAAIVALVVALLRLRGHLRWTLAAAVAVGALASLFTGRWQAALADLSERAAIWQVALSAIREHWLVGVGPEMFIVAFGEHVGDEAAREIGRAATVDRAHSGVLDFGVSYGAVAAVLLVTGLVLIAAAALKAIRGGNVFSAALGAGIAAYALQQQVFFAHPAVDMTWWLLIGLLAAGTGVSVRSMPRAVAVAAGAVCAALIVNAGSLLRNDRLYSEALKSPTFAGALEPLDRAASHRPFDDASYVLIGALVAETPDAHIVLRGVERLRDGADRSRGNELVSLALADALLQAHSLTGSESHAVEARDALSELIASQPANGDAYLRRGIALHRLGDVESARSDWQRAEYLMPERSESRAFLDVIDTS